MKNHSTVSSDYCPSPKQRGKDAKKAKRAAPAQPSWEVRQVFVTEEVVEVCLKNR